MPPPKPTVDVAAVELDIRGATTIRERRRLERLSDRFIRRGVPEHIRSDNGAEFTATKVREWLERIDLKTLYNVPVSPTESGYVESFNGKLRDELLERDIFETLWQAKVLSNDGSGITRTSGRTARSATVSRRPKPFKLVVPLRCASRKDQA